MSAGFVAGEMIGLYGWRSVLYVGGILPIALVPLLLAGLPESIRHLVLEGTQPRRIRALLLRINPTATYAEDTQFIISEQHGGGVPVKYLFMDGRALATTTPRCWCSSGPWPSVTAEIEVSCSASLSSPRHRLPAPRPTTSRLWLHSAWCKRRERR